MRPCFLKIITFADGERRVFSQDAELSLTPSTASLRYIQNASYVFLCLRDGKIFIERKGDYTFRFCLVEGETTSGVLGLAGAEGVIKVFTRKVVYTIKENLLLLSVKYTLFFDGGKQEMLLRLTARHKKNSEEE